MYIANHYVKVNGKMYTRGEIIPDGLDESKLAWLMRADAIHEAAPAPESREQPEPTEQAENHDDAPHDAEEAPTEETEDAPEDEIDEDAEVPEIDIMDGVVTEPKPEPKKPAPRAKTTPKKQAERRKTR